MKDYNHSHDKWPNDDEIDAYAVERGSTGSSTTRELRDDVTGIAETWYGNIFGARWVSHHLKSRSARSKQPGWILGWEWVRRWVDVYPWHVCLFVTVDIDARKVTPAGWLTLGEIKQRGDATRFERGTIYIDETLTPFRPLLTFDTRAIVVIPPTPTRALPPQVSR